MTMGGSGPESKAKEVVQDVVEFFKTPPAPEPELDTLLRLTRQDGKYYLVPDFSKDPSGKIVTKMSHRQFNSFIYKSNIEILGRKKRPFEMAVDKYKVEIRSLKSMGAASFRRSETNDANIESLESRIKIMLENWDVQYRNKRSSTQAQRELERIRELQRQLGRMRSQTTDEIFGGTFDKYYFDIAELDRLSKNYAQNGGNLNVTYKKETFTGNVNDLISFYEHEIDFIEDNYLDDMNKRVRSNTYYLNKLNK